MTTRTQQIKTESLMKIRIALLIAATLLSVRPALALDACFNTRTGAIRVLVKGQCRKTETPVSIGIGSGTPSHWSTTQNVAHTGTAVSSANAGIAGSNLGSMCSNSDIPPGVETPVAQAISVNSVNQLPFDVVLSGSVLLANKTNFAFGVHVFAYVGTPTNCDSFATCSPQMTKLSGLYDAVLDSTSAGLNAHVEVAVPFTFNQVSLPPTATAMEYITVMVDDNGRDDPTHGTCVSASGYSDEHDHIE